MFDRVQRNVTLDYKEIEKGRKIVPIVTVQNRLSPFFREAIKGGVVAHCARTELVFWPTVRSVAAA